MIYTLQPTISTRDVYYQNMILVTFLTKNLLIFSNWSFWLHNCSYKEYKMTLSYTLSAEYLVLPETALEIFLCLLQFVLVMRTQSVLYPLHSNSYRKTKAFIPGKVTM